MAQKLRRGDTVLVVKGRDRGRQGRVQRVIPSDERLLVEGVNLMTRHVKATGGVRQAGIIQMEAPLAYSSVKLMCPRCNRPVRVGFTNLDDGKKVRVCKKCHETIE
jgi:large subunit ribosomal protein L24